MKQLLALASLLLLTSCATPTKFVAQSEQEAFGYRLTSSKDNPNIRTAYFEGNSATNAGNAFSYSYLAAAQDCHRSGLVPLLTTPQNFTTHSTYNALSSSSYRVGNQNYTNYYSTPVTVTTPRYATTYSCFKQLRFIPGIKPGIVSKELAHNYVQDFKGALLIETVEPSVQKKLQPLDIILEVEGKRIEDIFMLTEVLSGTETLTPKMKIIRNKKPLHLNVPVEDHTQSYKEVYMKTSRSLCNQLEISALPEFCREMGAEEVAAAKN